ncbi:MAG: hypothetical protein FWD14_04355 [Treponema sp.]|nr:hypothetical protein [Treponema sp.]
MAKGIKPKPAAVKKQTVKKPAAKKPVKKTVKKSSVLETLGNELKSLIPKLDEEGLAFLVKQAHVHLYNMQVDALNQTIIKDAEREKKTAGKSGKTTKINNAVFSDIKISESGSGYHIRCNNQWIAFTTKEITAMVKIAKSDDPALEIQGRLFNWLLSERGDLLNTAGITSKFDDKIKVLIGLLSKNFKLKK